MPKQNNEFKNSLYHFGRRSFFYYTVILVYPFHLPKKTIPFFAHKHKEKDCFF